MNFGPTYQAIRYAVSLKLDDLNDAIRLALLENDDVFLQASHITRPNSKECFAKLLLGFGKINTDKIVQYEIDLSNKKLPVWCTQENSIIDISKIVAIVDTWFKNNVTMV